MTVTTLRVASGFNLPVYATAPAGDTDRLFVIEQHTGQIKIFDLSSGTTLATPFLTVPGISQGGEQGLLGLAFHPDYATNGLFYVNFTNAAGDTVVREYKVSNGDPNLADPASARTILTIDQPASNHNGGWLGFGPDDQLYIASGDGGGAGDTNNHAQDITDDLLGKILRIDINSDDFPADPDRNYAIPASNPFVGVTGDDEIWAYGLRNPWRPSFDRLTGDFYIADVGQGAREEVNFQPASSDGGENYGWHILEGTSPFTTNTPGNPPANDPSLIAPIHEYSHVGAPNGGNSITGGYVYRGPIPELQGVYFFADFVSKQIWSFRYDGATKTEFQNRTTSLAPVAGNIGNIASFAEDGAGNLYIIDYDGELYRLATGNLLFTAGNDTINFNAVLAEDYLAGTQYDALAGNDVVTLPDIANASAAGFVIGTAFAGGTGNDTLNGGDGNDVLLGANGDDSLTGNTGNDTLTGGPGNDIFGFAASGNGSDRVADLGVGDRIRIAGATLTGTVAEGPGTALAQNQVELAHGGGTSTLFVRTQAGTGAADVVVTLTGAGFGTANFLLSGTDIVFTLPPAELSLAASQTAMHEGTGGTTSFFFTVTRTVNTTSSTEVGWSVQGSGPNPATGGDFPGGVFPAGNVSFAAGQSSQQIEVVVAADTGAEPDEGFTVTLANPTGGAILTAAQAAATILNDDNAFLAIAASEAVKAETTEDLAEFRFNVSRSGDTNLSVTVDWSVSGNGANPANANDFFGLTLPSGMISFAPGEITKNLVILVFGDNLIEPDEGFKVVLSNPSAGAEITVPQAEGTILNDDHTFLSIAAADAVKAEGNGANTPFTFLVQRTGDLSVASSVHYQVSFSGGQPADAADFAAGTLLSGTINFAPDEPSKILTFNVAGDALDEADESFIVTLSNPVGAELSNPIAAAGLIRNDELALMPLVSIAGAQANESSAGAVEVSFTLTLAEAATAPVSVLATTTDGSAMAGSDYVAKSEPVVFAPGETSKLFTVTILNDTTLENNEQFLVALSDPVNAALAATSATATIVDDDSDVNLTLDGIATIDGDAGIAYWGGPLGDFLEGNGGNDTLVGLGDGDLLDGGSGADLLAGDLTQDGSDYLNGGEDDDTLIAGGGDDTVLGGSGADLAFGDGGADTVFGGDGSDLLFGGAGDDYVWGDGGNDTIDGGDGADLLEGGEGNDQVRADGADLFAGGGAGRDRLVIVGGGIEVVELGAPDNQNLGGTGPRLQGFEEVDASLAAGPVFLSGAAPLSFGSLFIGSPFADLLLGGVGADTLVGGGGADLLTGNLGADDFVYLGLGSDDIVVADFTPGTDRVVLDPRLGLTPAAALAATHVVGDDAVLDLGAGGSITLAGLAANLGAFTTADFAVL